MERKEFFGRLAAFGLCPALLAGHESMEPAELEKVKSDREFVRNWLADLLQSMEKELDRAACERIVANCGRQCYNRHEFKQAIARKGSGDPDKLVAAYRESFEAWREGNAIHVRYGKDSPGCYCPAARYRPPKPDDLHCECTRATHQAVFEAALQRPVRVEILETVRRGGRTCHFLARI